MLQFFTAPVARAPIQRLAETAVMRACYPESAKRAFAARAKLLSYGYNPYESHAALAGSVGAFMRRSLTAHDGQDVLSIMDAISDDADGFDAAVVEGFPVDPPEQLLTPNRSLVFDPRSPLSLGKHGLISEYALLAFNACCGLTIKTYPALQAGFFAQHVCIKDAKRDSASHAGAAPFPLHMDGAHNPEEQLVNIVTLLALRNYATATRLVPIAPLESRLRTELGEHFDIITQPCFTFYTSAAYDEQASIKAPLAYLDQDGNVIKWRIQGNRALIIADAAEPYARRALEVLFEFMADPPTEYRITLQHGQLLVFNNLRMLHTRDPIPPIDADRHLLRTHGLVAS